MDRLSFELVSVLLAPDWVQEKQDSKTASEEKERPHDRLFQKLDQSDLRN